MKTKLTFPTKKFKYYDTYCSSIKVNFQLANAEIEFDSTLPYLASAIFYFKINDKLAIADFSDYNDECTWTYNKRGFRKTGKYYNYEDITVPIFKRTMSTNKYYPEHVFALGPYFVEHNSNPRDLQYLLSIGNIYDPIKGSGVFHSNRLYASGMLTRKRAFSNIKPEELVPEVSFIKSRVSQYEFWKNHGKCLSTLNISGSAPHSQDKNPIEAMFMGVCGIANNFDIELPHNEKLDHTQHYICLTEDFSDINEKLNYVHENRAECKDIGDNAYELMIRTCTPEKRVAWMTQVVEEYYG